jgi:hypothetical protein
MAQTRRMGLQNEKAPLTQSAEVFALPFGVARHSHCSHRSCDPTALGVTGNFGDAGVFTRNW